jgi:hypothetical protein
VLLGAAADGGDVMTYVVEVKTLDQKWVRVLAFRASPGTTETETGVEHRARQAAAALEMASGFVLAVRVIKAGFNVVD